MYIARVLFPVKVLGPGSRIAIWLSGCQHYCRGCSNPELWEQKKEQKITIDSFKKIIEPLIENQNIDGFTITGGDPFFQPEGLKELLPYLYSISHDVLVYTGYQYEDLQRKHKDLLRYIAVLIDGKYEEQGNQGLILRGSNNQRIIILDDTYGAKYIEYISQGHSQIQNFATKDGIVSVGIHLPEYEERLSNLTKEKGLEKK